MCSKKGRNTCRNLLFTMAVCILAIVSAQAQDIPGKAQRVERITLKFEDGDFNLLSRQTITKVIPQSDELPQVNDSLSGFWYELQGFEENVIYRRIIENPVRNTFEGPDIDTPENGNAVDRKESIPQSQIFTLLIPFPPSGAQLVLFGSPLLEGAVAEPAEELASIPLTIIE